MEGPVAILGLGLMGGSLAHDLSARGVRVLAYDATAGVVAEARSAGVLQQELTSDFQGIQEARVVVLATPVDVAEQLLDQLAPLLDPRTLVTDLGSTKGRIAARAAEVGMEAMFVGSHPFAGGHQSGWRAARRDLYRDATVFVCPTPSTPAVVVERVTRFWEELGARPTIQTPDEHDRRMASLSHLPQMVASALAAGLAAEGLEPRELGPGGRDMTRLAASSPEMWAAIALSNPSHLRHAIARLQERLSEVADAIDQRDRQRLLDFFGRGRDWLA